MGFTNEGYAVLAPLPLYSIQLLLSQVVVSAVAQISLGPIPQNFTHLKLVANFTQRGANGNSAIHVNFNNDVAINYAWHNIIGDNNNPPTAAASGFKDTSIAAGVVSGNENGIFGVASLTLDILAYTSSLGKGVTGLNYGTGNLGSGRTTTVCGQYFSASPITSIQIAGSGNNLAAGSMVSVYGLL